MASHVTAFSATHTPLWLQRHVLDREGVKSNVSNSQNKGKSTQNATGWPFTVLYRGSMRQGGAVQECLLYFSINNSVWLSDECQSRKKTPLITTSNNNLPPPPSNALLIMQKGRRMWRRSKTRITYIVHFFQCFSGVCPLVNIYTHERK